MIGPCNSRRNTSLEWNFLCFIHKNRTCIDAEVNKMAESASNKKTFDQYFTSNENYCILEGFCNIELDANIPNVSNSSAEENENRENNRWNPLNDSMLVARNACWISHWWNNEIQIFLHHWKGDFYDKNKNVYFSTLN